MNPNAAAARYAYPKGGKAPARPAHPRATHVIAENPSSECPHDAGHDMPPLCLASSRELRLASRYPPYPLDTHFFPHILSSTLGS